MATKGDWTKINPVFTKGDRNNKKKSSKRVERIKMTQKETERIGKKRQKKTGRASKKDTH